MNPKIKIKLLPIFFLSTSFLSTEVLHPELVDRIAAVVNDKAITLSELQKEMINLAPSFGYKASNNDALLADKDLSKRTLDHIINEILIEGEIKKRGIEISSTELEMFIRNIMSQNGLKSMDELRSALAFQGMTLVEYRDSLRKQLERTKVMNYAVRTKVDLSEQDLKNYYMQNMDEMREPDAIHLKNIFINKDQKNESKKRAKAETVLAKLKKDENFEKLVKKYSEDANTGSGGDLGFLTAKDINPKIYEEVSKIKAGKHTGIIDTASGFYIIKLVESRKGEIRSFESAKEDLKNKLMGKELESKFSSWLLELRSQSHIDIKI